MPILVNPSNADPLSSAREQAHPSPVMCHIALARKRAERHFLLGLGKA